VEAAAELGFEHLTHDVTPRPAGSLPMNIVTITTAAEMERWPNAVRVLLGCGAALLAALLTYWIVPLREFPMLLAFPLSS
jgi:hypothetical protein